MIQMWNIGPGRGGGQKSWEQNEWLVKIEGRPGGANGTRHFKNYKTTFPRLLLPNPLRNSLNSVFAFTAKHIPTLGVVLSIGRGAERVRVQRNLAASGRVEKFVLFVRFVALGIK